MSRPPARKSSLASSSYFTQMPPAVPVTPPPPTSVDSNAVHDVAPEPAVKGKSAKTNPSAPPPGTQRVATYWPHEELLELARSAYVSDRLRSPGSPTSFARWIGQALTIHAQLTPAGRETATLEPIPTTAGRAFARPFNIPEEAMRTMRAAQRADLENNHVRTRTEFTTRAIRAAITTARQRSGGQLPRVEGRLPGPATDLTPQH
ncbi:MAG: hypothetical protein M3Y49_05915 [Actinomycetota bacterium]|nr:hypothetical protein [Actinomycetota bacterium]